MRHLRAILLTISAFLLLTPIFPLKAQQVDLDFGNFEVGIPGNDRGLGQGQPIGRVASRQTPFLDIINSIALAIAVIITIVGVIVIVIAGYTYMTAGGSAEQVGKAKKMIGGALLGIALAVGSVAILNTINPRLGSNANDPKVFLECVDRCHNGCPRTNPQCVEVCLNRCSQ